MYNDIYCIGYTRFVGFTVFAAIIHGLFQPVRQ